MSRPLHAYALLPEDRLPADVIPFALAQGHPSISRRRPPSPLVSFVLARVPRSARFAWKQGGIVRPKLPKDLVGAPIPARLETWSPRARRTPWPEAIYRELHDRGLEHISPVHFCWGCFPRLRPKGTSLPDLTEYPGVPELYMWAYGLDLTPLEMDLARTAMITLLHDPIFLVWAANPEPDYIPRSFAPGPTPIQRIRMFSQLKTDPLSISMARRPRFLDLERATPGRILELPRRLPWTPRSKNLSLDPELRALQIVQKGFMRE